MTKKTKILLGVVAAILIGCIGGLGYITWMMWDEVETSRNEIAKLEKDAELSMERIRKSNQRADKAQSSLTSAKLREKRQKKRADELQLEIKELKESTGEGDQTTDVVETVATSTPTPTPTATATPTVEPGYIPNGGPIEPGIELTGTYTEPGSGRVTIRVMYHDEGAPDDYVVLINGSSGADDSWQISATGNYDSSINGIRYSGASNTFTTSGTLIVDHSTGTTKLSWTDSATGNTNRLMDKIEGNW